MDALLKQGHAWVVDADLKSYFDTIPHERLMTRVKEKVAEGRVLALLESHLRQQVLDGAARWTPEGGTPQGAIASPLLSNSYLDPLDQLMARQGFELVRYAADFVVLCRDAPEAECALATVRRWVAAHGLILHPEKTRLVDSRQAGGFDFRGYHFERGYRGVSRKSQRKLRDAIRAKTKRANGHSMTGIIIDVNRTLRGWFAYFKHSHYTTFTHLDSWVRMRLRSILRKRHRLPGRGRGADHQRWPNAYFTDLGLFSTRAARAQASQSARR